MYGVGGLRRRASKLEAQAGRADEAGFEQRGDGVHARCLSFQLIATGDMACTIPLEYSCLNSVYVITVMINRQE